MNISSFLASKGRSQLLTSIIEPDFVAKNSQKQYIIKKVPLAQKLLIQDYQQRTKINHSNVLNIYLEANSKFYLTVFAEKTKPFNVKDLLMVQFQKRALLLLKVLRAIDYLSTFYGFFYLNEKMLGYNEKGEIVVWIHDDIFETKRKYPIDHGKLSEQIFVVDFKQCFGGNLRQLKQFYQAKSLSSLILLLEKGETLYHSIYMSQPPSKESLIYNKGNILVNSYANLKDNQPLQFQNNHTRNRPVSRLKHSISLNKMLKREISISYMDAYKQSTPLQTVKKQKTIMRTLSSPINIRMSGNIYDQQSQIINSRIQPQHCLTTCSSSNNLVCSNSIAKSMLPKIQFIYNNLGQFGCQYQGSGLQQKQKLYDSSIPLSYRSEAELKMQKTREMKISPQPLKQSYPYTTTHTFVPFASNGNISLNFNQSSNFSKKGINFVKDDVENLFEQHISEQSNEVEMDLQCLFSQSDKNQGNQNDEEMKFIMEQFESILFS